MKDLKARQRGFRDALLAGPDRAAGRMAIYANAYRINHVEALKANFRGLAKLLTDAEWRDVTQAYLAAYPPDQASMRDFGHRLADWLGDAPAFADRPWLSDMARFDWLLGESFDAPDATALAVAALAAVPPQDWGGLIFVFHPSLRRFDSRWNVGAMRSRGAAPERGEQVSGYVIWREAGVSIYRGLADQEAAVLDDLMRGATFEAACDLLATIMPADDAPLAAASFLRRWIEDGLIADISPRA